MARLSPQTFNGMLKNPFYCGIMRVKGELHPHAYEPIISKELFDKCTEIRTGRKRTEVVTDTKHEFLFRGMIKCATSGRSVTCDLKKGKYVYLLCRDPRDASKKLNIKEQEVLEQIRNVFAAIQIPDAALNVMLPHLRNLHESEKVYHHQSIEALKKESADITKRQDDLVDLLIDKSITKEVYDRKHEQLTNRRCEVSEALERHHAGNEQFKIALTSLIELASRALELFDSSKTDEKRQLIGFMFSNLELEGATLRYRLRKPFDLFAGLASNEEWLSGRTSTSPISHC